MGAPPAPSPLHLLRSHAAAVSALAFSDDNERLYAGDAAGRVVVTDTRSMRPLAAWPAHTDGILGVQELRSRIITHGRDNKLHVWRRPDEPPPAARVGASAALPAPPAPALCYSLDVNALNYCRFALCADAPGAPDAEPEALIAVPNLVESSLADMWALPACERLHAAIGQPPGGSIFSASARTASATGILMALHLFYAAPSHTAARELRLLAAYESGRVELRRYAGDRPTSVEGRGWEVLWSAKLHAESVMAMAVSRDNTLALTVSADHLVGRYDLTAPAGADGAAPRATVHRTTHPGNGAVALRDDARVCAIGGWDGKIRLYATRTLKPLGTLAYHKGGCQAVVFARTVGTAAGSVEDEEEDEMDAEDKVKRGRWLAGGGKDSRVSIWALMSFERAH